MNRRDVRAVPVDDKMAVTIKKVGVIGSGQMGNGIAHVAALAGFDVVLNDVSDERLKSAMATINGHLSRQVAKQTITEDARKKALGRITLHRDARRSVGLRSRDRDRGREGRGQAQDLSRTLRGAEAGSDRRYQLPRRSRSRGSPPRPTAPSASSAFIS